MWQRKTKSNNVNVTRRVVNNSLVRSLGTWSPIQRMTRNVRVHLRVCKIDFVILFVILLFWWTASIKPRLLFSRAGYASCGLSLLISLLWTLWTLFRKYFIFCLVTLNPCSFNRLSSWAFVLGYSAWIKWHVWWIGEYDTHVSRCGQILSYIVTWTFSRDLSHIFTTCTVRSV